MSQRAFRSSWSVVAVVAGLCAMVGMGMECPNADTPGLDPTPAPINTAPRVVITDVRTPAGDNSVEQGGLVEIDFSGSDNEDRAMVRVFASVSPNPTPTDEIQVLSNFPIGPGTATGTAFWPTNTVPEGSYTVFAEINDGTFDNSTGLGNRPVRVAAINPVLVTPPGVADENIPPELTLQLPASDAGLTNNDVLTVRYTVSDENSDQDELTATFFFDRDQTPANDATQPPIQLAQNVIPAGTLPPGALAQFNQDITIDLNQIPIRVETDEGDEQADGAGDPALERPLAACHRPTDRDAPER